MKTRILAMLLALAMIVTVFAACGGETATSTSTSTSTSVSTSTSTDAGDDEATITAKAEARKALGIGGQGCNLSRTQLINLIYTGNPWVSFLSIFDGLSNSKELRMNKKQKRRAK